MQLEGDKYRAIAFQRVAETLVAYNKPILTEGDIPRFPGMGKSSVEIIQDILKLGYSKRLQALQKKHIKSHKVLERFKSYYGIGSAKALELYQAGARSLPDLRSGEYDQLLPQRIRQALPYAEDLQQPIPRWEMQVYDMLFDAIFDRLNLRYLLAGSYCRGNLESGDLDVLVQINKNEDNNNLALVDIVNYLQPIIVERLVLGNTLFNGIARLEKHDLARRIDIRYIPEHSWACACIYFTGDRDFNILLRRRAQSMGYQLNEYELKSISNNDFVEPDLVTEEDVFRVLNMPYVPPHQRNKHVFDKIN